MIPLRSLRDSFEGVVPSVIATSDPAGVPNISYLSHVHFVDDEHVALSNQFFSKTAANVQTSGSASVMVVNGRTGQQHVLHLRYVRSERDGPLYERLRVHLAVGAASQGMRDVMRLRAVDIYRVMDVEVIIPTDPLEEEPVALAARDPLSGTRSVCQLVAGAEDFDSVLDHLIAGLVEHLGFRHVVLAVPDEANAHLITIASHGYDATGIAAETPMGEGVIGTAGSERMPVRVSDLGRANRYVAAVSGQNREQLTPIPFPGLLAPRSQMAVPVVRGHRLLGVIFVEAETPFAFDHADELSLEIIACQLASAFEQDAVQPSKATDSPVVLSANGSASAGGFAIRYDANDGSVFIDDEYLIRGIPGRLLHHFVTRFLASGTVNFTNRDLRRDPSLQLPAYKDNLETRLILLRRRLEEKGAPIQLGRPGRGVVQLTLSAPIRLEVPREK